MFKTHKKEHSSCNAVPKEWLEECCARWAPTPYWTDPSEPSTPELWRCGRCDRLTWWLADKMQYLGIAKAPRWPWPYLHSRVTQAFRAAAIRNLDSQLKRQGHLGPRVIGSPTPSEIPMPNVSARN